MISALDTASMPRWANSDSATSIMRTRVGWAGAEPLNDGRRRTSHPDRAEIEGPATRAGSHAWDDLAPGEPDIRLPLVTETTPTAVHLRIRDRAEVGHPAARVGEKFVLGLAHAERRAGLPVPVLGQGHRAVHVGGGPDIAALISNDAESEPVVAEHEMPRVERSILV